MEKVRVGIVGSKFAGMLHAESYKRCPHVEMAAVAAIDNLNEFADQYNIPKRYEDYHEMFADDSLDLISVCVPNYLHCKVVLAAVEAGKKAIICEKPFATSLDDGKAMLDACRQQNVKLMYAEDWIFAPALVRAKQICEEGGIGDILYVKAKESHNGSHSIYAQNKEYCGGGAMIHLGIHPIGFLPWLTGNNIVEVTAQVSGGGDANLLHKTYTGEDWATALVTFENQTRGLIEGNYITCGGMDDVVEIYGSEGNLRVEMTKGSPITAYSRKGYGYAIEKTDFTHGWTTPAVDELHSLGYIDEIAHFVDCVRNDREPQQGTTGADGLNALATVTAVYRSAETGACVRLEDVL
jgi:predicted dehydrogenase